MSDLLADPVALTFSYTHCILPTGDQWKFFLRGLIWRSVILDEGHRIKNEGSDLSKACCGLKARFKVILTGTPVQNDMHECWSLLHFLAPKIFDDTTAFDRAFNLNERRSSSSSSSSASSSASSSSSSSSGNLDTAASSNGNSDPDSSNRNSTAAVVDDETAGPHRDKGSDKDKDKGSDTHKNKGPARTGQVDRSLLSKAHYMMRPFILRRLKAEVEQTLPPKLETKINCPMSAMQKFWVTKTSLT